MNKKMIMFIICAVFALILSCKNYASSEDLKQNAKEQVEGFLDTKLMQGDDPNNSLFNPPPTLPSSPHDSTPVLKAAQSGGQKEVKKEDKQKEEKEDNKEKEEIEKKIQELKDKIEKSDSKKTSIKTYLEYEKEIKKIREELEEKLKDKQEEKEKLENELKELEKTLKDKKEKRKKALEDAKTKFEGYKRQVDSTTGDTQGQQVQGQGQVGQQAWKEAKDLGLNVNASSGVVTDTDDMSSGIIDDALKQIEEELNNLEDKN